jgi:hypothetical protein
VVFLVSRPVRFAHKKNILFLNSHSGGGGGVHTGSTRHVGHYWSIVPAPGDYHDGEFGGMKIGRGNRSTRRKPAPAPLFPPQIPLARPGPPRLTAWAMARPLHTKYLTISEFVASVCSWPLGQTFGQLFELKIIAFYFVTLLLIEQYYEVFMTRTMCLLCNEWKGLLCNVVFEIPEGRELIVGLP